LRAVLPDICTWKPPAGTSVKSSCIVASTPSVTTHDRSVTLPFMVSMWFMLHGSNCPTALTQPSTIVQSSSTSSDLLDPYIDLDQAVDCRDASQFLPRA
jgi:hypothetical protein